MDSIPDLLNIADLFHLRQYSPWLWNDVMPEFIVI